MRRALIAILLLASIASAQTVNPGRVNVVTTPWSVNWLTHAADAPALTDLGYSAWEQALIGSTDLEDWIVTGGAGTGTVNIDVAAALQYDWVLDVRWYGAVGDGVRATDGVATAADATFTSATMAWVAADVGKSIYVVGAGVAGALLRTTIAAINSPTSIELTAAASTAVNPAEFVWGTDDTAALETAFDARTDGVTIYIPHGLYLHTGLTVNRLGAVGGGGEVAIRGSSGGHWWDAHATVLWCMDPDADGLTSAANTTIIEDICFRSVEDDPTYLGNGIYLHDAAGVNACQVRNCWFQNLGQACIRLGQSDLTSVDNCTMELSAIGVDVTTNATNVEIQGCRIWGPGIAIQTISTAVNGRLRIYDSQFYYGQIDIDGTGYVTIQGNAIEGITALGNRNAIHLSGAGYASVTGNTFKNCSSHGIYSENGEYNLFAGNVFRQNQRKFSDYCAIYLGGTEDRATVVGNVCDNDTNQWGAKYGLYTEATTTNTVIGANLFKGYEAPTMILGSTLAADSGPQTVRDGDITVYDDGELGPELVPDGDFATDPALSGWTLAAGWTWDGVNFEVDHAGGGGTGTLSHALPAKIGHFYQIEYTISNYSAPETACILARVGGAYLQWVGTNATFRKVIQATSASGVTFTPITAFDGSIDLVSVKEIIGGDVYGSGIGRFNGVIEDVNNVTADLTNFETTGTHIINSSGAAITGAVADGTILGQTVRFVCKVAGNNIDISVSHHVTSDPEVIRLDTAKEWVELVWDGTDWVEASGNGQTYP